MRKSYNQNSSITRNCGLSQTLRISDELTKKVPAVFHVPVADPDIRNVRKCECQIFDRQNLSCEILRNHEKVDRIMHHH